MMCCCSRNRSNTDVSFDNIHDTKQKQPQLATKSSDWVGKRWRHPPGPPVLPAHPSPCHCISCRVVSFIHPCLLEPCGGRGPLAFSFSFVLSFWPSVLCECDLQASSKVQKPNEKEMNVCAYICTSDDSIVMFGQYRYPGERELTYNLLSLVFGFTMAGSSAVAYGRFF